MERSQRVIALGFFDGVHMGHGALLRRAAERAAELGAEPAAMTFDAHPEGVILGRSAPLLTTPPPTNKTGLWLRPRASQIACKSEVSPAVFG